MKKMIFKKKTYTGERIARGQSGHRSNPEINISYGDKGGIRVARCKGLISRGDRATTKGGD